MKLIFATNNNHKLREVEALLDERYTLLTPTAVGITEEIPEDQQTLEGNALQKARYIYNRTGANCFADDTGLEVEALGGAPGVYSARYAGLDKSSEANMDLLLRNLAGKSNRRAQFRTAIALIINGEEFLFEGRVRGEITATRAGVEGFGYDSIFIPEGYTTTFAQMGGEQKNRISHRGRAVVQLVEFLTHRAVKTTEDASGGGGAAASAATAPEGGAGTSCGCSPTAHTGPFDPAAPTDNGAKL